MDEWDSEEERQKRAHRREVIAAWKAEAKALRDADPGKRMLLREAKRESLRRKEDAARTEADFWAIRILWDDIEIVQSYRIGKQEERYKADLPNEELSDRGVVIPAPLNHVWWRQMMAGHFLDVMHDCPHDIAELTTSRPVYEYTKELYEVHKELLYYRAIRQWSPLRLAAFRGCTDRNIRKVYNTMIEELRIKMYVRLKPRFYAEAPLTCAQREFCEGFWR